MFLLPFWAGGLSGHSFAAHAQKREKRQKMSDGQIAFMGWEEMGAETEGGAKGTISRERGVRSLLYLLFFAILFSRRLWFLLVGKLVGKRKGKNCKNECLFRIFW